MVVVNTLKELMANVASNRLFVVVFSGSCQACEFGNRLVKEVSGKFVDVNFIKVDICRTNPDGEAIIKHFLGLDPRFSYNDVVIYFAGGIVTGPIRWPGVAEIPGSKNLLEVVDDALSMIQPCEHCKDGFVGKCPGLDKCPHPIHREDGGD